MKDRLTTSSYCFILAANFLLYFGFWLLIPVLPFYLSEFFQAGNSTIGIVLSCYTVAALCIRPFSGYLLDTFARKPLYLFAYFIFMMMFGGYLIAGSLTLFIMFRIIHGVSFGMVTVGGNTVVIDIMPSSRRGEGLGYYGLTNNTAMSIGPMFGLFLHDAGVSFATIFCYAFGACILGFLSASLVKTPYKPPVKREPISLDRFILLKGMPAGLSLLLLSIPYGMKNHTSDSSGIIFSSVQLLPARRLRVSDSMERHSLYDSVFRNRFINGHRIRNHVSGFQYLVRQPCPQQSARNGNFHLPDLLGCGNRYRYADGRIYRRNKYI